MRQSLLSTALLFALTFSSTAAFGKTPQIDSKAWLKDTASATSLASPGQKPFELLIRFTTPGLKGETFTGTYHYQWINPSKWREETTIANFQELRIGGEQKFWVLSNMSTQPIAVYQLQSMLDVLLHGLPGTASLKPAKSFSRKIDGLTAECLLLKDKYEKLTVCRDPKTHALLQFIPKFSDRLVVEGVKTPRTEYLSYSVFDGRQFPRELKYWDGSSPRVDAIVEKLQPLGRVNSSLFVPPSDAHEVSGCGGVLTPPQAVEAPDPTPPDGVRLPMNLTTVLEVLVGTDGKVYDPIVQGSAGKKFDREALRTALQWRFRPATCDGQPVAVHIDIQMHLLTR